MVTLEETNQLLRPRLRKPERHRQILLELRLHPHVRISELANRFGVSNETLRRDMDELSGNGLINRAHGGASAPAHGHYPGLDERNQARMAEREGIGRRAAALVRPGDMVMIDSGSTTLQLARFLAFDGTRCTVITNSLTVAMTLGNSDGAEVILCPGDYLSSEAAVVGTDAIEFLARHNADRCLIGASGLSARGPSEDVRGFAAIKRAMLHNSAEQHLLIDYEKFGRQGASQIGGLEDITSVVVDHWPDGHLLAAISRAQVEVHVAPEESTQR